MRRAAHGHDDPARLSADALSDRRERSPAAARSPNGAERSDAVPGRVTGRAASDLRVSCWSVRLRGGSGFAYAYASSRDGGSLLVSSRRRRPHARPRADARRGETRRTLLARIERSHVIDVRLSPFPCVPCSPRGRPAGRPARMRIPGFGLLEFRPRSAESPGVAFIFYKLVSLSAARARCYVLRRKR